jgi:hypothetical protein
MYMGYIDTWPADLGRVPVNSISKHVKREGDREWRSREYGILIVKKVQQHPERIQSAVTWYGTPLLYQTVPTETLLHYRYN